jgi:cell division septum initiation protein DivIVA
MQILNALTKLRKEMAETEHAITQAWQRYSQELSTKALAEAEATTKRLAALHRRLASRLEHIAGEGRRRWGARTRRTLQNPPDAPPSRADTPPLRMSAETHKRATAILWDDCYRVVQKEGAR